MSDYKTKPEFIKACEVAIEALRKVDRETEWSEIEPEWWCKMTEVKLQLWAFVNRAKS